MKLANVIIEFCYLVCTISIPFSLVVSAICNCCRLKVFVETFKEELFPILLIWLIVAISYSVITKDEIKPIPSYCPSDFSYPHGISIATCRIRLMNLIFMWLFVLFGGLWIQAAYFGILPKDNDLKRLTGTYSYVDESPPPYWSN